MNFSDLDFSTLQDIPPLRRYYDTPRISVTEQGLVSMNGALRREAGAQREFRAKLSPDGCYLALCLAEPANIRFSAKGGYVTHTALAKHLEESGFLLPAIYTMEWCPEHQAWVGRCQELPQPPALPALERPKGTGKRSAAKRGA